MGFTRKSYHHQKNLVVRIPPPKSDVRLQRDIEGHPEVGTMRKASAECWMRSLQKTRTADTLKKLVSHTYNKIMRFSSERRRIVVTGALSLSFSPADHATCACVLGGCTAAFLFVLMCPDMNVVSACHAGILVTKTSTDLPQCRVRPRRRRTFGVPRTPKL